ncbi:PREDICTED: bifunctional adenosine 5'-phosphosulfate phosphorylase/adenylylsulfatase HINT4-like isoform X2 [Tarenaya hassleriana]|uniref:bifunctional adenosine 5'-phosphosulfate phosphorylase/adenylylsulfatase HINT4-like isoform X2 n=1 Tax=Tarenaya hassleriana TaxID=28532 RepID=UPI00053C441E|nr:PREDICTED: bifunctional adenosine 5'-phosphosulfate phosphorylase/adenylylsulfatase HINT4-like isoform X2 [Tarenaya hassleriana]
MAGGDPSCIFCPIARNSTSTPLLHSDEKVVAFQDIKPAALRHYLVIPKEHIPTVRDLQRRDEDYSLVSHMLSVGHTLLQKDAPQSTYRFGFHQPPLNSVDHLHLHCFALPFIPRWKAIKYKSLGPLGGFIEAEALLEKLKPLSSLPSKATDCMCLSPSTFSSVGWGSRSCDSMISSEQSWLNTQQLRKRRLDDVDATTSSTEHAWCPWKIIIMSLSDKRKQKRIENGYNGRF